MQGNLFSSMHGTTPKSVKYLIITLICTSLLSPVVTFFLSHYFSLPGPQNFLPLSLYYLQQGYLFTFISYPFVHSQGVGISIGLLFSLSLQMFMLWFAGSEIAKRFGERLFLSLFFSATLISGLVAALALFLTKSPAILFGTTPALFALLSVWMLHMQEEMLSLFLFFRIKARTIVLLIFGVSLLIDLSHGEMLHFLADFVAILYGCFFGIVFCKLTPPFSMPKMRPKKRKKSSADIIDITSTSEDPDDIFMDQMLDKIALVGREGLTAKEKERMDEIVKRRRNP